MMHTDQTHCYQAHMLGAGRPSLQGESIPTHGTKSDRRASQRPGAHVRYAYLVGSDQASYVDLPTRELAAWALTLYRDAGMTNVHVLIQPDDHCRPHATGWTWTHQSAWDRDTWQALRENDIILRSPSGYYMQERDRDVLN